MSRRDYFGEEFEGALRKLRTKAPTKSPVKIVVTQLNSKLGLTYTNKHKPGHWLIKLCKTLLPAQAIDTLIHEWAHVLDLECNIHSPAQRHSLHDCKWGAAYSKCYRSVNE